MAFAKVGDGTYAGGGSTTTSIAPAKPTGVAEGDIMFAVLQRYNDETDPSTVPSGWTLLDSQKAASADRWLYYKVAGASEGESYTWEWSAGKYTAGFIVAYRDGFDTADPIDTYSNTAYSTLNTTMRAAEVTVSADDSPVVFVGVVYSTAANATTQPADFTEDYEYFNTTPDAQGYFASRILDAGATGAIDATLTSNLASKHAFLVALNPPGEPPAATSDLFLDGVWG